MNKIIFKTTAILLIVAGAMACKKSEKEETNPLADTTWKLVGFVDAQADTIKSMTCDNCFYVTFHRDGTLSGRTSTNDAGGTYEITNYRNGQITILFYTLTEVMEHPDGILFIECMNNVTSYTLLDEQLSFYYNPTNYLLFNSYIP